MLLANNDFDGCIDKLTQGLKLNKDNIPLNKDMERVLNDAHLAKEGKNTEETSTTENNPIYLNKYKSSDFGDE